MPAADSDTARTFEGSIVAMVTPFHEDSQKVHLDAIQKLVAIHAEAGTTTILPCGTTGESPTLSHGEHQEVIQAAIVAGKGSGLKVLAGTGSNSTQEACEMTEQAAEAGADGCLIVAPYYNKPSPAGLRAHFRELNKIGVPLIVYNIPGRTGINIKPETLEEIAQDCENVVGLKASNGNLDEITDTARRLKDRPNFRILSGDDSLTLPIMAVGGSGVISVAANLMPKVMAQLVQAFQETGDVEMAQNIAYAIHPLCVAMLQVGPNPAPIKALMNRAGLPAGPCRLPLVSVPKSQTQELVAVAAETVQQLQALKVEIDPALARLAE